MIKKIKAKTLLSSAKNPDPWFGCKYNMNLYRGCQHQCIYCDSKSECYQIENFADILVKVNAIELLEKELKSKRIRGTIGFGAMNDCYMPIEKKYKLAKRALEVINKYKFPIHILTKSDLVLRDIDLIKEISKEYAAISFTITTSDDKLARIIEPYAPLPSERYAAMKRLADAGIYTGITMMPILPFLEDTPENITEIVEEGVKHGAQYIIPGFGMTLRDRQKEYYYKKLDEYFPGMKQKYIKTYGNNYSCWPRNGKQLKEILSELGQKYSIPLRIKIYKPRKVSQSDQAKLL
jgi:DNA repair photolyase